MMTSLSSIGIIVGIDPDARKSGVCEMNASTKEFILRTMCFFDLIDYIKSNGTYQYCLEDITNNRAVFNRGYSPVIMGKIARNVGQVQQTAIYLREAIERYASTNIILVKAGVGSAYKKNAALFNQVSGWTGRSNPDTRDAWAIARDGLKQLQEMKNE